MKISLTPREADDLDILLGYADRRIDELIKKEKKQSDGSWTELERMKTVVGIMLARITGAKIAVQCEHKRYSMTTHCAEMICRNYVNNCAKHGILGDLKVSNLECPDCGESIHLIYDGQECPNCGHIFYLEEVDSDE